MKTIFYILVLTCLNIQNLFSDQKEELEIKIIRKKINEIKAKRNKVEANKKAIFELQEDMLSSSVSAPSKAWCFLSGGSPDLEKSSQLMKTIKS